MHKHNIKFLWIALLISIQLVGQDISKKKLFNQILNYRKNHEHQIIKEYFQLLSIPNVSSDGPNVRKNAEFIKTMMES